jgi:hypothetical protein
MLQTEQIVSTSILIQSSLKPHKIPIAIIPQVNQYNTKYCLIRLSWLAEAESTLT